MNIENKITAEIILTLLTYIGHIHEYWLNIQTSTRGLFAKIDHMPGHKTRLQIF